MNLANASVGATVSFATSTDARYPPGNIIDGDPSTYWITTGLFPQEFVLTLESDASVKNIHIKMSDVQCLSIETSADEEVHSFDEVMKKEFQPQNGQLQSEEFVFENAINTRHLKFVISKACNHFVSIHSLTVH